MTRTYEHIIAEELSKKLQSPKGKENVALPENRAEGVVRQMGGIIDADCRNQNKDGYVGVQSDSVNTGVKNRVAEDKRDGGNRNNGDARGVK